MVQLGTRIEPRPVPPRAPATRVLITGTFLAGLLAILVGRWWTGTGYVAAPAGLPDPGWVTAVGLPVAQYTHDIAAVTVAGLLFLRCAALPASTGPGGAHLLEMAARWAWIWVAGTVAWITLTVSELTGAPVDDLLRSPDLVLAAAGTDRVLAETATLWVALAVALFVGRLPTAPPVAALLLAATAALLPSALTGHAGHHDSPTIAMLALAVHLAAAAAWVGGLLALVVHLRPFPDELRRALPRFSAAALMCLLAVGSSGIVEGVVTLRTWTALWVSDRGHLILAKTVGLAVLAAIGYAHRKRTLGPAGTGRLAPLLSLAAGELLIMGATTGLAVILSTTG